MADHLKVVEPLHPSHNPKVKNLHERLMEVIQDFSDNEHTEKDRRVTKAEIVGTLEFVKADCMELFE